MIFEPSDACQKDCGNCFRKSPIPWTAVADLSLGQNGTLMTHGFLSNVENCGSGGLGDRRTKIHFWQQRRAQFTASSASFGFEFRTERQSRVILARQVRGRGGAYASAKAAAACAAP